MTIWFDMDGTIADLYGVNDWCNLINSEDVTPYVTAEPLCDMEQLTDLLGWLQNFGIRIGVISWTSKRGSKSYNNEVRKAKIEWLNRNLPIVFDEIHIVKYGTPKQKFASDEDILFDDNANVRNAWRNNRAYNPITDDIITSLEEILEEVVK